MTLAERRANDKDTISKIIKDNSNLLVKWDKILSESIKDKRSAKFIDMNSVDDFIDGFELNVSPDIEGR